MNEAKGEPLDPKIQAENARESPVTEDKPMSTTVVFEPSLLHPRSRKSEDVALREPRHFPARRSQQDEASQDQTKDKNISPEVSSSNAISSDVSVVPKKTTNDPAARFDRSLLLPRGRTGGFGA